MAVIVRLNYSGDGLNKGDRFILLGAGYGAFKATRPGVFFGNLSPIEESSEIPMVLVCNASGETAWVKSSHLEVVSVDGVSPSEVLSGEREADGS